MSRQEVELIKQAIEEAESRTSAEIRVVVERRCRKDPYERAVEYFNRLEMYRTAQRNGVLIYVARNSRHFAIIGDEGIHSKVGKKFWEEVAGEMRGMLSRGGFAEAIRQGVKRAGEVLARYFPRGSDDVNELPNEVVY